MDSQEWVCLVCGEHFDVDSETYWADIECPECGEAEHVERVA